VIGARKILPFVTTQSHANPLGSRQSPDILRIAREIEVDSDEKIKVLR